MKAHKQEQDGLLPFLDLIGEPSDLPVDVELDFIRGVMHVSCEGQTVLRICRSKFVVTKYEGLK